MSWMTPRSSRSHRWVALLLVVGFLGTVGCESIGFVRRDAEDAVERGDWQRAEVRVNQVLAKDPSDWKGLYYRGLIRLEQQRPGDAAIALERSLALRDGYPEAKDVADALAEALYRQDDAKSLHDFLARRTRESGRPADYMRQAKYLTRIGDHDGAKVAFRKAVHFWPSNDITPHVEMADFYESIGDKKNTIAALTEAYKINPNIPRINNRLRALGVIPGPTLAQTPESP